MKKIADLLDRDLSKKIEEIIQVDQTNEEAVFTEITEYVPTASITSQYRELLKAIADAPADPDERIGVWVSGFFGSGKSSFSKNLGYVLANPLVRTKAAAELFKAQFKDSRIESLVDSINTRLPTELVMFDVSKDRAVRQATQRLSEIMYTVLLRQLDYAEDFDIAELEIELEGEGKLQKFIDLFNNTYAEGWSKARKGAQKISRASAILHQLEPRTYATSDSWSQSLRDKGADITVTKLVDRAFELSARRRPGKGLMFVIDEVGQYVARSTDKIEDLRAVVEQFGKISKNKLQRRETVAPVWIVVTSQEKLDEVVAALDSKRVDIAKLQDRFRHRVDLAPADIREVATKRVLAKKKDAEPLLRKLFSESQGQLNAACRLERTTRKSEVTEADFVQFYPYLPHYIELSIDIMSGIRLQPGAPKHLGGSNRTIIKQAYEMLVSERTGLAHKAIGTLVTLDRIFELVEGNLSSEKQKDISDIRQRFAEDPADAGMTARVAKALALLEFVRDLPRTEANIAACLVERVGDPAPVDGVNKALERLQKSQFVRNTEDGWKLQTAQEKNWESERGAFEPRPKDRNDIVRESLRDIFADPKLRNYRYRDLRTFKLGLTVDGVPVGDDGQIPLTLLVADDANSFNGRLNEARDNSRQETHKNEIYWVFSLTAEIDDLVATLFASRQMVAKYDQMRAQNRITGEEAALLQAEKTEGVRLQTRLRDKLAEAIERGQGIFRGIAKDAPGLGKSVAEIFRKLFDFAVPDLYPKLEMGARHLEGDEAEEFLKAANLSSLSQLFYSGEGGLNLVTREGAKFVPNPTADIAKEVTDFIRREHQYGNKVTGKALEEHFGGIGYGWDFEMLRVVLAVLLRAGTIEMVYQGRRFRNQQDPQCRVPFTNKPAFRAASFAPRESIDLKTLTTAVQHFEELSGEEVDVEEGAIAAAFKKLAEEELKILLPVEAVVKANRLPVGELVDEYRQTLTGAIAAASDDCVRTLAGEGRSLRESRDSIRKIRDAVSEANLALLRRARATLSDIVPQLMQHNVSDEIRQKADTLNATLRSPEFYEHLKEVASLFSSIFATYRDLYAAAHERRKSAFLEAVDQIKGQADWQKLQGDAKPNELSPVQASLLTPLTSRLCESFRLDDGAIACSTCTASLGQMESDVAAVGALRAQVFARFQELLTPPEEKGRRVERVRFSDFFGDVIDSEQALNEAVDRLREHLQKLLAEGAKIVLE